LIQNLALGSFDLTKNEEQILALEQKNRFLFGERTPFNDDPVSLALSNPLPATPNHALQKT
jgi:hypothetical protein